MEIRTEVVRGTVIAFLAALAPLAFFGQSGAQPRFEVASIKPSDGRRGIDMQTFPRRLSAQCSMRLLIEAAYSLERWQLAGGPAWLDDLFDVEATTAEDLSGDTDRVVALGRPASRKMMLMLQGLLAERCNLRVHRETRQDDVYALVAAKNPPKLRAPQDTTRSFIGTRRTGAVSSPAVTVIITGYNASMGQLAKYLATNVHRPVSDETGIKGNYDFQIEYAPEDSPAIDIPPFFTAIESATGLKLRATKGPVEFLVVDHVDKPSPN